MSRGTGRVRSEIVNAEEKKNPGFIWNSRTYQWEIDPTYKGPETEGTKTNTISALTPREIANINAGVPYDSPPPENKEGFGLGKIKKKKTIDTKGNLLTNITSRNKLKIKKGQGKRKFRVKNPFVGGLGGSSNIGLS